MPGPAALRPLAALALAALCLAAAAEKADRGKPMTLESDQPCTVDLIKQTSSCSGRVVIAQGTLLIRAERIEVRTTPEGYQMATASGTDARPASYRQRRDGVDEHVEGQAQRIDYDGRANTLRFEGQANVRRLRGTEVADEIQGSLILWDNVAEQFTVQGGAVTPGNPGGRVRAVLAPREAPASANPGASTPAAAGSPLRVTPALGDRR